ncbi:amidohydrolase [Bacillus sp. ISL-40]|uniref:amidohydrolase n=1 Tax=unclassified Bacillus (in: firmicutes) TaxID=185979 RepID=UPI001BEB424A|nr:MULTISPECIES: amidohydrolase [unclassified Bacillus (in: firmicutes)]MBT2699933.1 amidohydrolase [Bacillus sp. ISL-40]MBT2722952.1 amidohydrolase [Bacillus sp. ISL-46]MBT2743762.1 amidohydrolase [Bacillus sp. ISL-77]
MAIRKHSIQTFINGKIFTSNPEQPYASTMIVRDGTILWIGEQSGLENIKGDCVDLKGHRVLPGLIDSHLHPLWLANASTQIACTPPLVNSIADLIEQIQNLCKSYEIGKWIEGWGYDEGKLSEGREPTRWDLDEATADIPIFISRTCTHIAVVNSKALELAGITKDTPDPQGGKIDRDSNGEPTGILRENAKDLVHRIMPTKSLEENAASLAELSSFLLSHGITAITDLSSRILPTDYMDMYKSAVKKGLKQRTVLYYLWDDLKDKPLLEADKIKRENQIHIGGIKLFSDGSVSGKTAWVNPPFLGEDENYGIQTTTKEELLAAAEAAEQNHIQLVVHAMGEQAIDLIIDTFYGKKGWLTNGPSIRIEHAAMPSARAIQRAAETGIAFVTQPIFVFAEIESYHKNLGSERTKQTYPIRSMLQAGIKVAFSSDAPATAWADPVNPFVGIKSAVTRLAYDGSNTGQEQRIDVSTAIMLYTKAAQEITRIPHVGQLAIGNHADFIVLNQDIFEISIDMIDTILVKETYLAGNLVFQR